MTCSPEAEEAITTLYNGIRSLTVGDHSTMLEALSVLQKECCDHSETTKDGDGRTLCTTCFAELPTSIEPDESPICLAMYITYKGDAYRCCRPSEHNGRHISSADDDGDIVRWDACSVTALDSDGLSTSCLRGAGHEGDHRNATMSWTNS